jgi:hypothetical protein
MVAIYISLGFWFLVEEDRENVFFGLENWMFERLAGRALLIS